MKKFIIMICFLLCFIITFYGCNRSTDENADQSDSQADSSEEVTEDNTPEEILDETEEQTDAEETTADASSVVMDGKIASISDVSEYWNNLYKSNEQVINAYEGMPIMELVTPGLCFVTGVQYDLLNLNNEDGRFEGELMLAGYPGFIDKKGNQLTFGYEYVLEEDGFSPTMKAGDKEVENGNCDLAKGYYYADSYTEREGAQIKRSTSEFAKQEDGNMCALVVDGYTIDFRGSESLNTSYIFIRSGEGRYDFVVGKSAVGTAYDVLHLEADMTKDMAIAMFEEAGATIENSGQIKDGKLVLD